MELSLDLSRTHLYLLTLISMCSLNSHFLLYQFSLSCRQSMILSVKINHSPSALILCLPSLTPSAIFTNLYSRPYAAPSNYRHMTHPHSWHQQCILILWMSTPDSYKHLRQMILRTNTVLLYKLEDKKRASNLLHNLMLLCRDILYSDQMSHISITAYATSYATTPFQAEHHAELIVPFFLFWLSIPEHTRPSHRRSDQSSPR